MRWRFGRFQVHGQCEELLLPYLSEAGITTYLVQRFGEAVFSPALVRALHQRTNGNPLFLVTVVEEMVRQGRLRVGRQLARSVRCTMPQPSWWTSPRACAI
jgi:hypothetical protein